MGNRTRQFSLTRPIMYQGENYPSAEADISYGNGVENNGRIFVDANGNYFALDSKGNALEAMVEQNLSDTVVTAPVMDEATRREKENIQQRQAMMRAAGYNVPQDGSWDSQQDFLWNNLTTRPKKYDTTMTGFFEGLHDKLTGNSVERMNPLEQGYIRTYDPDNVVNFNGYTKVNGIHWLS